MYAEINYDIGRVEFPVGKIAIDDFETWRYPIDGGLRADPRLKRF
ncbi:MAG: hypothetical protein ACI915_000767 [Gammaproteobacteria bacterium]|jgi:hypothetical protein